MAFVELLQKWKKPLLVQLFTVYLRYLIGSAFIIAAIGMGKLSSGVFLMNADKASLCDLHPIQQFFRVMADSGLYWKFIGWTQIAAGVLLLTQRFAKLGALIFFGLILNIFMITVSYEFRGTPVVTGLMLLATVYLLLWDADTLQYLFRTPDDKVATSHHNPALVNHPFWIVVGVLLFICIVTTMLLQMGPLTAMLATLALGIAGLVTFLFTRGLRAT